MPASANTDGKIVFCFKNADKFIARYSTLAFEDVSPLDGAGDVAELWPVSHALERWSPASGKNVTEPVRAAIP